MKFKSILDLMQKLPTEKDCRNYFAKLRWGDKAKCVYCAHNHCYTLKDGRYRCANCKKSFTVKVGAVFENSKLPLQKWLIAYYLSSSTSKGLSSITLAKQLGVKQSTAWFMLHRIRTSLIIEPQILDGEIELDETYIGGKERNKHDRKKIKGSFGGANKIPVFAMLQRGYIVQSFVVPNTKEKTLEPIIKKYIAENSIIYTDEYSSYNNLIDIYQDHKKVCHSKGNYVNKGNIHTNSIEGFWSFTKRTITGVYHYISLKHLNRYMQDLSFRYNERVSSASMIFEKMVMCGISRRLTYKDLIAQ